MRPIKADENYIDVLSKIDGYLQSNDNNLPTISDITGNIINEIDDIEKLSLNITDDRYKNNILNDIHMIRINLMDIIDNVNDIHN